MLKLSLLPRPHSCDRPRVPGYEPLISGKVTRISKRRKLSWRWQIFVDDCPMATGHADTKTAAESKCGPMLAAYAQCHYISV